MNFKILILILIPFFLICKEKIPETFHWIHLDSSPLSKQEIQSIRSWQKLHPKWDFKLWTNVPCSLKSVELCNIPSSHQDFEKVKKTILQNEGGIFVDLRLMGCKRIAHLILSGEPFQTADGRSLIGCPPHQYEAPRRVLPESFILPNQVFTTHAASHPLMGTCFWTFEALPSLTEELWRIHSAKTMGDIQIKALSKKLSRIRLSFALIVLRKCS